MRPFWSICLTIAACVAHAQTFDAAAFIVTVWEG
jgi:hypothetical protein